MKNHSSMQGCTSAFPGAQHRAVAPAAGESSDDRGQVQLHSAMNMHIDQSGDAPEASIERPDGFRIRVRFPPAADKRGGEKRQQVVSSAGKQIAPEAT